MKQTFILAGLLVGLTAAAQTGNVGINENTPNATLHLKVASVNADNDTNQGIIIPKLTKERVAKIANDKLVTGTLVFVEGSNFTSTNTKVSQITSDGFYHYDGNNWVKGVATDKDTTYTGSTSVELNSGSFQRAALTGDVTAALNNNNTTLTKIQGKDLDLANLQANQVLTYNGTKWVGGRRVRHFQPEELYDYNSVINILNDMKCKKMRTDLGILTYDDDRDRWMYRGLVTIDNPYTPSNPWRFEWGYVSYDLNTGIMDEVIYSTMLKINIGIMTVTPINFIECISAE